MKKPITLENVGDLKAYLSVLPDDMPVQDFLGNRLSVLIHTETTGKKKLKLLPTKDDDGPFLRNDSVGVTTLSLVGITVDEAIISTWTDAQYWSAMDWATSEMLVASDHDDITIPPRPEFLEHYLLKEAA